MDARTSALLLSLTLTALACGDQPAARAASPTEPAPPSAAPAAPVSEAPLRQPVLPDHRDQRPTDANEVVIDRRLLARFAPLPQAPAEPAGWDLVELGRTLFHDPRLSADHGTSCSSCHPLDAYGTDGLPVSQGVGGQPGRRNAPTVYNAAFHFAQFWDGRAATIEEQATGPMLDPTEMGGTEERIVETLASMPGYRAAFANAFPEERDGITLDKVARALGAFQRTLVTRSAWDAFLAGDEQALTTQQLRGLKTFLDLGCVSCHTGPEVGASMFQKLGAVIPWPDQDDSGRLEVTGREVDRMVFKVPTMKNVARTGPYLHDGSAATLEEAVRLMGRHQLGLELTDQEVEDIVAWMDSLTGELPAALLEPPSLPPATSLTPAPLEPALEDG